MGQFSAIRAGLAANLQTIDGLLVYRTIPNALVAPAAIVSGFRRIRYGAYRNKDEYRIVITVWVANPTEPAAQDDLDLYAARTGPLSIPAAVLSDRKLGGAADDTTVLEAGDYKVETFGNESFRSFEVLVEVIA